VLVGGLGLNCLLGKFTFFHAEAEQKLVGRKSHNVCERFLSHSVMLRLLSVETPLLTAFIYMDDHHDLHSIERMRN
jgi:hypothetical protein